MAKQVLNVGSIKNDGTGDSLRDGAKKINDNFTELYNALGATTGQLSLVSRLTGGDGITVSSPSGAVIVTAKTASSTVLGAIKVGDNLTIDNDGVLSANAGGYTLPIAERGTLGGIKIGDTLQISETGVVNVVENLYTLPTATAQQLGGVKIGSRLTITNGVLSADVQSLPTATTSVKGGVIVDGVTIGINGSGVISVLSAGASLANGDHTFALNSDGTLSLDGQPFTGSGGASDRITANGIDIYVNGNGTLVLPATDTELVNTAIVSSTANIQVNSNGNSWTFDSQGFISLPNGNVIDTGVANKFIMETGGDTDFEIFTIGAGNTPLTSTWTFGRNGTLKMPPAASGASYQLAPTTEVTVPANSGPTVVYTSTGQFINSMKAIITVFSPGAPNQDGDQIADTQVSEILITTRYTYISNTNTTTKTAVATVYGVTHTSDTPLATFTVNVVPGATSGDIQILAQPTGLVVSEMDVQVVATEILGTP